MKISTIFIVPSLFLMSAAFAQGSDYAPCLKDTPRYTARSLELKTLADEDQADRSSGSMKPGANTRDRDRRKRVGEIFGEGCFKSAEDFAHAAIIYQHGGDLVFDPKSTAPEALVPEHIFQAFIWANRAVELGHGPSKWLAAAAIDRYLWFTGKKQLFGTQAGKNSPKDLCWCLVPTESGFPDSMRQNFTGVTLQQSMEKVRKYPGQGSDCPIDYCKFSLKSPPKGSVQSLW